ncbi:hypothetical protein ZOSMA_2G02920 [Zostera marina]|nr:hypothetical protein ZOSMA_2G02920 [Zostera marina]
MFSYIDEFKMSGHGIFDGMGKSTWGHNDRSGMTFPTSLQFSFMNNSIVEGITSKNSKMFHIMILACIDMKVRRLKIIAPEDSPNTDGIHIALSTNVEVTQTQIGTGDDCISIGPTNNGITITDVECGPGHGISVGSLGKYSSDKDVSNVLVKDCKITKTTNGVRIKTWEHSFPMTCRNFTFENIKMVDVSNPIIIDQHYCPTHNCGQQTNSKVKIIDMKFKNIEGTSETPLAINLKCSETEPCADVHLSNINLRYTGANLFKLSSEAESESESETPQSACINVLSPIISDNVFPKACF